MKEKLLLVLLGIVGALALLGLYLHHVRTENPIDGGITDKTDYLAPKTIESREITAFYASFYRFSDNYYDADRQYAFRMTEADGKYIISEGYGEEAVSCEVDEDFAAALDALIRDADLIRKNGTNKVTAGLAPEWGPWELKAQYASGEKLYFRENGDPQADWTLAVLDLFAEKLSDLLPAREESKLTGFSLSFAYDDVLCTCGEVYVPVTEEAKNRTLEEVATLGYDEENYAKMLILTRYDRKTGGNLPDNRQAEPTEEFYAALQSLAEKFDIRRFHNGEIYPPDFDFENTPQYYEFCLEYESGTRLSGFSAEPQQCAAFREAARAMAEFCDAWLDENTDAKEG